MRARKIYESVHFERGKSPKKTLGIGVSFEDDYEAANYLIHNMERAIGWKTIKLSVNPDSLHPDLIRDIENWYSKNRDMIEDPYSSKKNFLEFFFLMTDYDYADFAPKFNNIEELAEYAIDNLDQIIGSDKFQTHPKFPDEMHPDNREALFQFFLSYYWKQDLIKEIYAYDESLRIFMDAMEKKFLNDIDDESKKG